MSSGIRAIVSFSEPEGCPIAAVSGDLESPVRSVSTSVPAAGDTRSVSEFTLSGAHNIDHDSIDRVFSIGSMSLCRVHHTAADDCPCVCLGEFETPIARLRARGGTLTIHFHATDFDDLQTIIGELRRRFESLNIKKLIRASDEHLGSDRVWVDRGCLTERQLKVLETAYHAGYFERPRGSNATEIAAELDIAPSTFTEHISVSLSKLVADVLEEPR